ncbi:MAG: serine/threonine protein phosphatase, partial [Prevotellaceae bacterium]|nr:serine/threonine protein phosphatase [Candidatus Colivivens equi]
SEHNCWIAMVRGNHDDPSYFTEQKIHHERFRTISDYSVVNACGHQILCVGGAISIDRSFRLAEMRRHPEKQYYWQNEPTYYDATMLNEITSSNIHIDTVITHTAPSFCELQTKNGLMSWAANDPNLLQDCDNEREQMDMLFTHLKQDKHPVTHWFYGHFHQSWHGEIFGVFFKMLDIMELHELR